SHPKSSSARLPAQAISQVARAGQTSGEQANVDAAVGVLDYRAKFHTKLVTSPIPRSCALVLAISLAGGARAPSLLRSTAIAESFGRPSQRHLDANGWFGAAGERYRWSRQGCDRGRAAGRDG